jgi:hypothetical protein
MLELREGDPKTMSFSDARRLALDEKRNIATAYCDSPAAHSCANSLRNTIRPRAFRAYHLVAMVILAVIVSHLHVVPATAKSENPQLQRLIDIEEIKQLRARFANAVDNRRWDELRSGILAKDCVVDVPSGMVQQENRSSAERTKLVGDEAIIAFIRNALGDKPGGSHAVSIPIIETLSPTSAKGTWRLGTATYFDTYVKIDGRWRMQSIRFEPTEPGPGQNQSSSQQK